MGRGAWGAAAAALLAAACGGGHGGTGSAANGSSPTGPEAGPPSPPVTPSQQPPAQGSPGGPPAPPPPPAAPPPPTPRCGGQAALYLSGAHPGLASAFRVVVRAPGGPGAVLDLAGGQRFRVGTVAVPASGDVPVSLALDAASVTGGALSGDAAVCAPPLAFAAPAAELDDPRCELDVELDGRSLQPDPATGALVLVPQASLRSAAGAALSCELSAGLVSRAPSGAPALAPDGAFLMAAPAAPVLHVDGYPALLAVRVRVANAGGARAALRRVEGDPAALTGARGGWTLGGGLSPGTALEPGAALEETVVVPVPSQAACVALGGEADPAPAAPMCADGRGGGLRFVAAAGGAQAECRARLRCGPDAPRAPAWSGARQIGWAGSESPTGIALDAAGALRLALWAAEPPPSQLAPHAASATIGPQGAVVADDRATAAGLTWRALAVDGTGAMLRTESSWGAFGDVLVRVAPDGHEVWRRSEGTADVQLAPGPGGTVVTAGYGWLNGAVGTLVTKYDAAGAALWRTQLATPPPLDDRPAAVAIDGAGSAWVLGYSYDQSAPPPASHVWLARLDAAGRVLWRQDLPPPPGDAEMASGLAVAPDGTAAIASYATRSASRTWVRAFAPGGAALWTSASAPGAWLWISGVAADPVDGFWVSATASDLTLGVARLDGRGSLLWSRALGPRGTQAGPLLVAPGGDAFVSGATTGDLAGPNAGGQDAFVVRLGRDGLP